MVRASALKCGMWCLEVCCEALNGGAGAGRLILVLDVCRSV